MKVFLVDFADFAVIYEIKFYMGNHARINEINDAVRTNVWYELKRQGITIPFPIRTLHVERQAATRAGGLGRGVARFCGTSRSSVPCPMRKSTVWSTRHVSITLVAASG